MLVTDEEAQEAINMADNIFYFIEKMWGLIPQPIKPEFEDFVKLCIDTGQYTKVKKDHFQRFIKFEHITWQQFLILSAYQRALDKKDKKEISTVSGHGIGKSASLAWIIFHFLFAYEDSNIACTAPSADQMFDVLWKEASKWHGRMKLKNIKNWFEITSDKITVCGREKQWWAKAKTASKDKPEALSGVHSDDVLFLVDEASAVADIIYENGLGSLTNENYVFIMISNGTKDNGLFYRSHNDEDESSLYQHLQFSSEDSPVVDPGFCAKILKKAGGDRDDDLYRVRVRGLFPKQGSIENKNYFRLVKTSYLNEVDDEQFYEWDPEKTVLGIDPSGKGKDRTTWVLRDNFRAKLIGTEKISNELSIARKTFSFLSFYNIIGCPIVIDNFGKGANVGLKIIEVSGMANFAEFIYGVNVGDKLTHPRLKYKFYNLRAYYFDLMNEWLIWGGEVVKDKIFREEIPSLLYTYDENEIIRMIPKRLFRTDKDFKQLKSPNAWDALMLTFKKFDPGILREKSIYNKQFGKNSSLSNRPKNSIVNSEDYLDNYL